MGRLHKCCPFIDAIAMSAASKVAKLTKPKPRLLFVSCSRITFGI